MLSISSPYYYHKVNMFLNIIVLISSTIFQTYDIKSYDHDHMPFHHPQKLKLKLKGKNIKLRKILVL